MIYRHVDLFATLWNFVQSILQACMLLPLQRYNWSHDADVRLVTEQQSADVQLWSVYEHEAITSSC